MSQNPQHFECKHTEHQDTIKFSFKIGDHDRGSTFVRGVHGYLAHFFLTHHLLALPEYLHVLRGLCEHAHAQFSYSFLLK